MVVNIKSDSEFEEITNSISDKTLLALYFYADWAEPCKHMSAVFSQLEISYNKLPDSNIKFLSIEADALPNISESFDVSAVPFFVFIKDNTIIAELSGADPKELANIFANLIQNDDNSNNNDNNNNNNNIKDNDSPNNDNDKGNTSINTNNDNNSRSSITNAEITKSIASNFNPDEDINSRLKKLTKAAKVMLFMKGTPSAPQCGFSRQIVSILRGNSVRFGFFDILKDDEVRQGLKTFSDWPTFPQLYIDGEFVGGLDILRDTLAQDPDFLNSVAVK